MKKIKNQVPSINHDHHQLSYYNHVICNYRVLINKILKCVLTWIKTFTNTLLSIFVNMIFIIGNFTFDEFIGLQLKVKICIFTGSNIWLSYWIYINF